MPNVTQEIARGFLWAKKNCGPHWEKTPPVALLKIADMLDSCETPRARGMAQYARKLAGVVA